MDLALGTPTTKHIDYCMKRLEKLRESGIRPLVVFDGGYLPMKAHTESDRRARRLLMKAKAKDFLAAGNKTKAFECFQSCVDVSPEMAWEWIKVPAY